MPVHVPTHRQPESFYLFDAAASTYEPHVLMGRFGVALQIAAGDVFGMRERRAVIPAARRR